LSDSHRLRLARAATTHAIKGSDPMTSAALRKLLVTGDDPVALII
jgi:hypothetical protein